LFADRSSICSATARAIERDRRNAARRNGTHGLRPAASRTVTCAETLFEVPNSHIAGAWECVPGRNRILDTTTNRIADTADIAETDVGDSRTDWSRQSTSRGSAGFAGAFGDAFDSGRGECRHRRDRVYPACVLAEFPADAGGKTDRALLRVNQFAETTLGANANPGGINFELFVFCLIVIGTQQMSRQPGGTARRFGDRRDPVRRRGGRR
jgi:hypothetical protein